MSNIYLLAPAANMSFASLPSGSTYLSDANGLIITASVADQIALVDSGCITLNPLPGGGYNFQNGAGYTVAASDNGNMLLFTSSSAVTVTLPATLPVGFRCRVFVAGTGGLSIVAGSGANAVSPIGVLSTTVQYYQFDCSVIYQSATNTAAGWDVVIQPTPGIGSGIVGATTLANLYSQDTTNHYAQYTSANVYQDGTGSNNGTWLKTGTGNGSGNWTQVSTATLSALQSEVTTNTANIATNTSAIQQLEATSGGTRYFPTEQPATNPASSPNAVRQQFALERDFLEWGKFNWYANSTHPEQQASRMITSANIAYTPDTPGLNLPPYPPDLTSPGGYVNTTQRSVYPVFDQNAYNALGQPNIIEFDDPTGASTFYARIFVSPADFAAAGINVSGIWSGSGSWSGANFSVELSYRNGSAVNLNLGSAQCNFYLMYESSTQDFFPDAGNSSTNVLVRGGHGNNFAFWLGGTGSGWANTEIAISDSFHTGYIENNMPAANAISGVAGQTFNGMVIEFSCPATTTGQPASIKIVRAIVSPNAITATAPVLNVPEDQHNSVEYGNWRTTLKDSSRILFVGDSITAGSYCLLDKCHVSKISNWLPYVCDAHAWSGGTVVDGIFQLAYEYPPGSDIFYRTNVNIKSGQNWYTLHQPRRIYSDFAICFFGENDRQMFFKPELRANLMLLAQRAKSLGIIPILVSAYRAYEDDTAVAEIADSLDIPYLCLHRWIRQFIQTSISNPGPGLDRTPLPNFSSSPAQLFFVSHPGSRASSALADPLVQYLKNVLPRPYQSIKVYRLRASVSVSGIAQLLADDDYTKNSLWHEISLAQWTYTGIGTQYDTLAGSLGTFYYQPSEYLGLMNNDEVSFGQYTLVEAILPASGQWVDAVSLNWPIAEPAGTTGTRIPSQNLQVYARFLGALPVSSGANVLSRSGAGYTFPGYQTRFFMASNPGITVGAVYTASGPAGNFTYVGYQPGRNGGEALFSFSTEPSFFSKLTQALAYGSGTLTKTSGTGPSSVSYTGAALAADNLWYGETGIALGNAIGAWQACDSDGNGNYSIPLSGFPNTAALGYARTSLSFDKVQFLVVAPSGQTAFVAAGPPSINWRGYKRKVPMTLLPFTPKRVTPGNFTELLSATAVCTGSSISSGWTANGGAAAQVATIGYAPLAGSQPSSSQHDVVVNNSGQSITANFSYTPDATERYRVQIVVFAGYFPALNAPGGGTGLLSSDTFDYVRLRVTLTIGATNFTYQLVKHVSAWWGEILFDTALPNIPDATGGSTINGAITVDSLDGSCEVSYVSMRHYTPDADL